MYAVTQSRAEVNGVTFPTFTRKIHTNLGSLQITAGTTGYADTPDARAARTLLRVETTPDLDLFLQPLTDESGAPSGFCLAFTGDDSLRAFSRALSFASQVLDDQTAEVTD